MLSRVSATIGGQRQNGQAGSFAACTGSNYLYGAGTTTAAWHCQPSRCASDGQSRCRIPVLAWIEPDIGDHLATPAQDPWLRHLRQQRGGKRLADTDDAEHRVRLPRSSSWSIVARMAVSTERIRLILERHGRPRTRRTQRFVLGNMIFRKYPEKFNAALDAFLEADPNEFGTVSQIISILGLTQR